MRPWLCKSVIKNKLLKAVAVSFIVFLVYGAYNYIWIHNHSATNRCTSELLQTPFGNESRIFAGRTKDNGQWFSQKYPFHLHVYSAFFDNRTSLRSDKQVAIIAVVDKRWLQKQLWCRIHIGHHERDPIVVAAMLIPSGAGETIAKEVRLIEHVIVCPVPSNACPPLSVSLAWGDSPGEWTAFHVPVEVSRRHDRRGDLAACVSTSYGDLDHRQLIEWIEMQSILGVELVVMYNHSISSRAVAEVLNHYAESQQRSRQLEDSSTSPKIRLEVRRTNSFLASDETPRSVYLHMSPSINDCMYRYAGSFRHFAVLDLDEVIVPRTDHRRLPDLLASLTSSAGRRVGAFVFRNAYFFLDLPPVISGNRESSRIVEKEFSTYLYHQRRMHPSAAGYSVKSIVDSDACIAMHNHYCWNFAPSFLWEYQRDVSVAVSMALLHHYKRCHFDKYLDNPGVCKSLMSRVVFDDVMKKYEGQLSNNLMDQYKKLSIVID